jgi:hypothetical protein
MDFQETSLVASVVGAFAVMLALKTIGREKGWRGLVIRRRRVSMRSIFQQLGPRYFQKAYRMKYDTFLKLGELLRPYITKYARKTGYDYVSLLSHQRIGPNGSIHQLVRLGCAIRYFAGGSPYDIMTTMGISRADVSRSVWIVVEAINNCHELHIRFPTDHNEQRQIALDFKAKSSAGFGCCVGAVDGILIWIGRPSERDARKSGCGSTKFFCGRKHKFGLNCQAICDAKGRFLDISLLFPGSTSDVLSFESSTIYHDLENGLLAPGLCLFGDNAYINTSFMATPYSGVSGGTKDAYNFYHSQLRINIECTFGRFVHRWAILRAAMPMNITIAKTTAMVVAMAKLHNFCLENNDISDDNLPADALQLDINGAFQMRVVAGLTLPSPLLNGGNHFDDMPRSARRHRQRRYTNIVLPRETLHGLIQTNGLTRPLPTRRRH